MYITNNLSELAINRQCSRHHLPTRRQLPNGVQDDARRVQNAGIWDMVISTSNAVHNLTLGVWTMLAMHEQYQYMH